MSGRGLWARAWACSWSSFFKTKTQPSGGSATFMPNIFFIEGQHCKDKQRTKNCGWKLVSKKKVWRKNSLAKIYFVKKYCLSKTNLAKSKLGENVVCQKYSLSKIQFGETIVWQRICWANKIVYWPDLARAFLFANQIKHVSILTSCLQRFFL